MTSSPPELFDTKGQTLELSVELGRGGEAVVYALKADNSRAVKLYHKADALRAKKLRAMLENPPLDPTRSAGHVSIAWPEALAHDREGRVVGFVMPLVNTSALALHQVYNPKARRQRAPKFSWLYLVRIARNLCSVVTALHDKGYVIGDLNESNILVTDRALVSLVDCDSVQVKDGKRVYRCYVGKAEYLAPEVQGKSFAKLIRTQQHDYFALSILLFFLLMEGVHPYAYRFKGEGEPATLAENIKTFHSPYLNSNLQPSLLAPSFTQLPRPMQKAFQTAFKQRLWASRPSSRNWQRQLEALEHSLELCSVNQQHQFSSHLSACPWCERFDKLGLEAFPMARQTPAPPIRVKVKRGFQGNSWTFIKRLPALIITLIMMSGLLSYGVLKLLQMLLTETVAIASSVSVFVILGMTSIVISQKYAARASRSYFRLKRADLYLSATLGASLIAFLLNFILRATAPNSALLGAALVWLAGFLSIWWLRKRAL